MKSLRRRAAALALTAAATAAVAVPAQADTDGVPPGLRGRVLTDRPQTGTSALPGASVNRLVTYTSEGVDGRPITVSGTVSLPRTAPPPGGWPVISWAHGTTGTADVCAPSADTADGPAHDYVSLTSRYLDKWVSRGYVVVQTDYEGLGTPGGHPYMNGRSAANTVLDMVRAARALDRRVGRAWFAVGHSQGGHAALFTAAARQRPRDLDLLGVVSLAPGGYGLSQTVDFIRSRQPGAQYALAFLPVLLTGAEAADPAVVPEELLTEEARPLLESGRSECTARHRERAATFPVDKVFRPEADTGPLTAYLRGQEPVGLNLRVPTLVAQGTADVLVSKPTTDLLVGDLCRRSPDLVYRVYQGADHRAVIDGSFAEALDFAEGLRSGRTPQSTC
jgi:hypothetical protein